MLVPRQEYSRELKLAAMREIDSGKGMAEVARMYQLSPKRLETWRSEWRAKGDLALRSQMQRIALRWPAYGYRRVHAELLRQGWTVNHKRVLRLL
jgi:transposase-like protein